MSLLESGAYKIKLVVAAMVVVLVVVVAAAAPRMTRST